VKITRIEPFFIGIPYDHGAPKPILGTGLVRTTMDAVYVRVDTDEGVSGWGESFGFSACPVTVAAFERLVTPLAIGRDPTDIAGLMLDLRKRTQSSGLNGPVGFALSGIDIALWDIAGKRAGKPVHALLGGTAKTRIPAYASLLRLNTSEHVSHVCGIALERGYRHVKLHERTRDAAEAARATIGPDIGLMLDTNCTFTPEKATAFARDLKPYALDWLEEPIFPADDYAALAALRREGIPIAAGENLGNLNEVRRLVAAGAVDIVQPDPVKMGGISECWKALQLAERRGVRAEPHTPYYGPGLIAGLHMIAAMAGEVMSEFFFTDLEAQPLGGASVPQDGFLAVPTEPGLGITVDETVLREYRIA
jgi:L-alanine-DL-glutamate epimerase-like enolase superfamily enzyme